jgi:hypothetical protein
MYPSCACDLWRNSTTAIPLLFAFAFPEGAICNVFTPFHLHVYAAQASDLATATIMAQFKDARIQT